MRMTICFFQEADKLYFYLRSPSILFFLRMAASLFLLISSFSFRYNLRDLHRFAKLIKRNECEIC